MIFQYKGKGILVPVYATVPLAVFLLSTQFIEETFFDKGFTEHIYQISAGLSLIVSGLWNWRSADDFYYDDEGEKHYIDFDNQFMWIGMKYYSYVFWAIGGFTLLGALVEFVLFLTKT